MRTTLWPYAADEALSVEEILLERPRGIPSAPGYPAQPVHSEKRKLFRILDAETSLSA